MSCDLQMDEELAKVESNVPFGCFVPNLSISLLVATCVVIDTFLVIRLVVVLICRPGHVTILTQQSSCCWGAQKHNYGEDFLLGLHAVCARLSCSMISWRFK